MPYEIQCKMFGIKHIVGVVYLNNVFVEKPSYGYLPKSS